MKTTQIEIRNRKFICPRLSDDHAMFFGSLLMDEAELVAFVDDEDPDRAFAMMSDRLNKEVEEVKASMAGKSGSEVDEAINLAFSKKTASRLMVRINQDRDPLNGGAPGLRLRLAMRLREVFPDLPKSWVSEKGINLDLQEIVTAIAIPLYGYLGDKEDEEVAAPTPAAALPVSKPEPIAILAKPIPTVSNPPKSVTLSAEQLDELPIELKQQLGLV